MPSATRARSSGAAPQAPKLGGGTVKLDATAFGARFNMAVVHETVRAELAARRRGTASTKTRGQVSGGGAKPWRQKGTGRARAGSSRSPVWTGGGTVFGPTPRRFTFKINRKERQAALRSALSVHAGRNSLAVFDAAAFAEPSTARAVGLLEEWDPVESILVVLSADEEAAGKSFRNISRVLALPVEDVGVADVIGAASLLVSETALPELVARTAGRPRQSADNAAGDGKGAAASDNAATDDQGAAASDTAATDEEGAAASDTAATDEGEAT